MQTCRQTGNLDKMIKTGLCVSNVVACIYALTPSVAGNESKSEQGKRGIVCVNITGDMDKQAKAIITIHDHKKYNVLF